MQVPEKNLGKYSQMTLQRLHLTDPEMSTMAKVGVVGVVASIILLVFSLLLRARTKTPTSQKSKAERAKEMKQAYQSIDNDSSSWNDTPDIKTIQSRGEATMEVTQLWVYPIKSLRGCQVMNATLTGQGLEMDRKFMLLHELEENPRKLKNMAVPKYPAMSRFYCSMEKNNINVAYRAPGVPETGNPTSEVDIAIHPSALAKLKKIVPVDMHHSPTIAYEMGDHYNDWFSKQFGFKVIFVYYGGNTRQVLGNLPGRPASVVPKPRTSVSKILGSMPLIGPLFNPDEEVIAFNDCAPFLVITEESKDDVSTRLPDGVDMDITKFRGNIIVKGAPVAFDEDFWGELLLGDNVRIILTANCGRCVSLNVDYETGKAGKGPTGSVLKLLTKDRRVDPGVKFTPIFGRYGFLSRASEGKILSVGDKVVVSRRLDERTKFYWPGIGTP